MKPGNSCNIEHEQLTAEINKSITRLEEAIKSLNTITITNGGGRSVSYRREQFFQMIYDRFTWNKFPSKLDFWVKLLLSISQLITLSILLLK